MPTTIILVSQTLLSRFRKILQAFRQCWQYTLMDFSTTYKTDREVGGFIIQEEREKWIQKT